MRKWMLLIAALLFPSTASASTRWFYNYEPIPEGQTIEVSANSPKIPVSLKLPNQTLIKFDCSVEGTQAFWNTPLGGRDETRAISFSCRKGTVTPLLPWGSTLLHSAPPLHDAWEGVALDVTHARTDYGKFTGSLDTVAGDVDPEGGKETGGRDEPDSYVTFKGGAGKDLTGPNGAILWFTKGLHLGETGSRITDEAGFGL